MGDDQKELKESHTVIPVRANWSIQGIAIQTQQYTCRDNKLYYPINICIAGMTVMLDFYLFT